MTKETNGSTQYNLTKFRQQLIEYFDESELRTVCFDIQVDYDTLAGQGTADKARELLAPLKRIGRISDLILVCRRERPRVSWGKVQIEGRYYINNNPTNTVIISRLSENHYSAESPAVWMGIGIFDGKTYFGVYGYKDTTGNFTGVWGVHKAELRPDESFAVHGTNIIGASGEFDIVWDKAP